MTTPSLLDELEVVVRLASKATPGEWPKPEFPENSPNEAFIRLGAGYLEFGGSMGQRESNAEFVSAAVNFLRTHHATLADMAKRLEAAERDAARYQWLRDSASKDDWDKMAFGCITDYQLDAYIDDATQEGEG